MAEPEAADGSTAVGAVDQEQPAKFDFSEIVVCPLYDTDGNLVSYIAGTESETSRMSAEAWTSTGDPGSALGCFKEYAIARMKEARAHAEVDGVMVNGNVFTTDPASQIKYVAILLHVSRNSGYTGVWKTINNGFVTLDATGVQAMCMSVMDYIQACFAWEQESLSKIEDAASIEELRALDLSVGKPAGQGLSNTTI